MKLWIGLHLPQLPLEVFRPNWSADTSAVVLAQERVLTLSPSAHKAGLRIGMRPGGVQMLAPATLVYQREPEREAQALRDTALALLQYSPLVTGAEEATLLLDIGASLRLFGGIRALCRRVLADMRTLGFSAALSCAPTAGGAWLLARAGGAKSLSLPRMLRLLDALPTRLLLPARPFLDWLDGVGCHRLGDLQRLPRPGLQRRCGKALILALDCAYGRAPELFIWIEAPLSFRARIELFDRLEQADAALCGAQRLLLQLTGWLKARQLAVTKITLLLEHERGRKAVAPTAIEIALAEATWRDSHLIRLLKERLAQQVLPAPVIALCLLASEVEAMLPPSETLFPEPGGSVEDHQRLLELLVARLGPEHVLQAVAHADHRPEIANRWLPLSHKIKAAAMSPLLAPLLPRPTWLLAKPIALLLRDHRPFYGSPLRLASSPERIEAGWWQGELVTRDYFVAEGRDHAHYWIYRERIGGEGSAAGWYLHGLFG